MLGKMGKIVVSFIIIAIIIIAIFFFVYNENKTDINRTKYLYPECQSQEDIDKYHNQTVILIGEYTYENRSKCWIAFIHLDDETLVVYKYQPQQYDVNKYNNLTVRLIGKVLKSHPISDEPIQYYQAPHIIEVESIEINEDQKTFYDINIGYISVWEGVTTEEYPTSFGDFAHLKYSKHDLLLISSSDDEHKITQSWETEQIDGHPYNFYICSINKTIESLRINWEGYVSQPFIGNVDQKLDMLIWNADELKWDNIISQKWENNEEMDKILKNDILNVTNYISDKNVLYILIMGPFGAGDSTATLATDFIEIKGA